MSNTEILNNKILKSRNIRSFLEENKTDFQATSFHHSLYQLIEEKALKNTDVFKLLA